MSNFFDEQGRTGNYDEATFSYVEKVNPRRTQLIGKRAISLLIDCLVNIRHDIIRILNAH